MTYDKGGDENQISFLSTGIPQPIKLGISSSGSSFKIYKQVDQFRNLRVRPFFPLLFFLTLPCLNNRLSNPVSKMKSFEFPYRAHLV